jgi:hypothetical protein
MFRPQRPCEHGHSSGNDGDAGHGGESRVKLMHLVAAAQSKVSGYGFETAGELVHGYSDVMSVNAHAKDMTVTTKIGADCNRSGIRPVRRI